ncbi:MAG: heme-copper oxidase subunit III [Opitutales bacterium]|jgi:heme/copper-type cytochrome/quinol oxidase subunit 3|nr:heme-copper oxidase subunit III [Opitutales bacterium]MDP4642978.1 heme-copper oxidase subunit III [Opitutales bacterium]MDP4693437.1 heme-copper oxidase subunit III [Opitutales bacterium]MDP4776516.1 heme-copper oxidase subunit III [Opitutales bacterium]MDP4884436.1 heme-copper oxidase subunit III [Opitutales bacterium]
MSDTATAHHEDGHKSLIIDNKKLLMWLFLGSDCMFFGTLISTHLIYRKINPTEIDPTVNLFSLELTSFSTFILLMSSFLMALAVSAMHKGQIKSFRRNVIGVIFFGLIFLGCQVYEFTEFVHLGLKLDTGTFGSTFYLMTGTHGVHVAIGIFWLICMYFYSYTGKMDAHESAVDVEVAGLYWHFVDIVWIIIFTVVYLIEFIGK